MRMFGLDKTVDFLSQINRNSIIQVEYLADERIEEGKYKKYMPDIDKGQCRILKVIRK